MNPNPLDLSPEQFRKLASTVTELAAQYLEGLDARPVFPKTSAAELAALFVSPCPEEGLGERALDVLPELLAKGRATNARMLGYVMGSGEPVAALGDLLASVANQNVTAWRSAPAAVTVERTVIGWLAEAIGCAGFTGSLMGGGSAANLLGLAMAREAKAPANRKGAQPGPVYASTEVHSSVPRAVALLGLGKDNLRRIPVDAKLRMVPAELERALQQDVAAGLRPIAVVASAGSVATGSVDPLEEIAAIARRYGAWLHVDGAYGALAAIAAPEKLRGLSLADSLSLDPHKWLYQPVDCGCALFKDAQAARDAFSENADYIRVLSTDPIEGFAFFEESFELSRRFRALKLWLSLRYHGLAAFRAAIAKDLACAARLAELVSAHPELELLAPVELSAVCFRYRGDDALNTAIWKAINARGRVYLSNATIGGKLALRACFTNHRSTFDDVQEVVDEVVRAGRATP